jgi:dGTPase
MKPNPKERIKAYENNILAPYACYSSKSRGRVYTQKEHPLRTAFQRDRDRVIHSAAFRRLEYKTQVFVNHEGDHYRTRLTHTIEVAQISRTIARALGLNEDLAGTIALVHDLGHTPFGHAGEDALNQIMTGFGGFNHNRQSLRVVDTLEQRYPHHPGLNLTYEVREGIAKHETSAEPINPDIFPPDEAPSLEAALVDIADSIAYNSHDVDDGLSSGILDWDSLCEIPFWNEALKSSREKYPDLDMEQRRHACIRVLVDRQVTDLIEMIVQNLDKYNIQSLDDVRKSQARLVKLSESMKIRVKELHRFLNTHLYQHTHLTQMASKAREIIETLFERYRNDPSLLHDKYIERLDTEPDEIVIADFIAGMTDRYAYRMFEELG